MKRTSPLHHKKSSKMIPSLCSDMVSMTVTIWTNRADTRSSVPVQKENDFDTKDVINLKID